MKTIATINFKGGMGKTTATWALGYVAALDPGIRTLFDLDAQMSLTQAIALNEDGSPFKSFSDWYDRSVKKKKTVFDALDEFTKPAGFNFGVNHDFIYKIAERYHFIPSVEDGGGRKERGVTAAPVAESWDRLAKKSRLTTVETVGTVASMRTIEIDLDIYTYLLKNAVEVGETASSILRRLLGLSDREVPQATSTAALQPSDLETHLGSMDFRYCKGVVGRFLSMLGWIYKNHQNEFHKIEKIQGRGRIYFARDVKILHEHGRSVNPKQIPGSPYWVITTTSTDLKQDILASVMKAFGYTDTDIRRATSAIAHSEYASRRQHILDSL